MHEPDVLKITRRFLTTHGMQGQRVLELYTDAHPTLTDDPDLAPFQRFTLPLAGMVVNPDLVGKLDDGETLFAIEAKGSAGDALQGLMQAVSYRAGVHQALLAVPVGVAGEITTLAQELQVGLALVDTDTVVSLTLPPPHLPRHAQATAIARQFTATSLLRVGFSFNMPTHYLSIAVALTDDTELSVAELDARVRAQYDVLPQGSLTDVLRGAEKLGMIVRRGQVVSRTVVGAAVAELLPSLPQLAQIHQEAIAQRMTIAQLKPTIGAVLRWLLVSDPIVTLLLAALRDLGHGAHTMATLARAVLARDRTLGLVALFHPLALATVVDRRGHVVWDAVLPAHFRSTTRYQYKSMLRQAGLIVPHPLGHSSPTHYQPEHDLWESP